MDKHRENHTLVHCAVNYRASAFTGLYLLAASKLTQRQLSVLITHIWQPDPTWQKFIEEAIQYIKKDPIFNRP